MPTLGKRRRYPQSIGITGMPKRVRITPAQRGYVRNTGLYGRFNAKRAIQQLQPELKWFETAVGIGNIPVATGTIIGTVNNIPEGNGPNQRIGRKITIKKIHFRALIRGAQTILLSQRLRVICYLDKQCNGAEASPLEIMKTNNTGTDYIVVDSFRNLENISRFQILFDKTYTLTPPTNLTATTVVNPGKHIYFNRNVNIPIEFDTTANDGSLTTIRSNNIGFLYIPDSNTVDSFDVHTGLCRIRYSDS